MKSVRNLLKKYNDIPIAAKATLWFVFCTTIQKGMSLITVPIFTRLMTKEQYGQYSVYTSWLQIFTIITSLRLSWGVFSKGMNKYKEDRDGYTSTMQSLTFMITTTLFLIYLIFHKQVNELTELPTFIMVAMFAELMVTPAIDFWTVRKRFEYVYKPVVFRTLAVAFLNAFIGIIAVLVADEKGYARILTCITVNVCFGSVIFIYNLRKGKTLFKAEYAKFALGFNLPLLLHYISQYVLDQFDRIMIQKMVNIAAAALYSVAYNAGMLIKILTESINNALVPWQYEKLEKKEIKELDNVLFAVYMLVAGVAVTFTVFAPEIMKLLADEKYYEAIYVIPPVALGMFFLFMYATFANVEFFYDLNKFTMYISMAGAVLNVILNYIGIKLFGYVAAGYTTLFCYIIFCFGHYIYMTKNVKKKTGLDKVFETKRIVILSAMTLACGVLVVFLYDKVVIRYMVVVVIALIALIKRKKIMSTMKIIMKK